jgi:hypothetical protein
MSKSYNEEFERIYAQMRDSVIKSFGVKWAQVMGFKAIDEIKIDIQSEYTAEIIKAYSLNGVDAKALLNKGAILQIWYDAEVGSEMTRIIDSETKKHLTQTIQIKFE